MSYQKLEREILSRLDLAAEAESLGLRFAGEANGSEWRSCHGIGRDDRNASAGFNSVTGRYRDCAKEDKSISFWDLAARSGQFVDWRAARDHYAKAAGVELNGKAEKAKSNGNAKSKPKGLDRDQLEFAADALHPHRLLSWSRAKSLDLDAVQQVHGIRAARWSARMPESKRANVIAIPGYLPSDWRRPVGVVLFRVDGEAFVASGQLGERKVHNLKGWRDGLVIVGTPQQLATATTVHVCEGVPDAITLTSLGLPAGHIAVTNLAGAGKFNGDLAEAFRRKNVCLWADADDPGRRGAELRVKACVGVASEIRDCRLPYRVVEKHGKDIRDFIADGGSLEKLMAIAEKAEPVRAEDFVDPLAVEIGDDPNETVERAIELLGEVAPRLFQQGGRLVQVVDVPSTDPDQHTGSLRVQDDLKAERVTQLLNRGNWSVKEDDRGKRVSAPPWVAKTILAAGEWPVKHIKPLAGVSRIPVMRPDGSICQSSGYDAATMTYVELDGEFPKLPDTVSWDDALRARDKLLSLVQDFPFKTDAGRSAWLAALLTMIGRNAYKGQSPNFIFDGNTKGTGKGKLVNIIGIIATGGKEMPATPPPADDEEMRKKITASVRANDTCCLIDNLEGKYGWPSLDAATTASNWRDRILGTSTNTGDLGCRITWLCTANNIEFQSDSPRRVCYTRLETTLEDPEHRDDVQIPELISHVRNNHRELLCSGLTVIRGWFCAGKPEAKIGRWHSFEGWSAVIRQVIRWLRLADPMESLKEVRKLDDSRHDHAMLLNAWEQICHGHYISISEALKKWATRQEPTIETPDVYADFTKMVETMFDGEVTAKSLGRKMRPFVGKVRKRKKLMRKRKRNVWLWKIGPHNEAETDDEEIPAQQDCF